MTKLTPIEIIESGSFPAAFSYEECAHCGLISNDHTLAQVEVRCSHCNEPGPRSLYPDIISMTLLRGVGHFFKRGHNANETQMSKLQDTIEAAVGTRPKATTIREARRQLRKMYRRRGESPVEYEKMLKHAARAFNANSPQDLERILPSIIFFSESQPKHIAVVLHACTMVERLLQELLVDLRERLLGQSSEDARKAVERRKGGVKQRMDLLGDMLGQNLKEILDSQSQSDWEKEWVAVLKKRNDFVHKGSLRISASDAEVAFRVAIGAPWAYSQVRNKLLNLGRS